MRQIIRANRRLSVAAGNIEHIIRLAQARDAASQTAHQFLPLCDRGAQMRGSRRQIAMVQVIGFDPAFDESPHQGFERCGIVAISNQQVRHTMRDEIHCTTDGHCARLLSPTAAILDRREESWPNDANRSQAVFDACRTRARRIVSISAGVLSRIGIGASLPRAAGILQSFL